MYLVSLNHWSSRHWERGSA